MSLNDTIVAISTPIGEGGIGIVRISGPQALSIADKIFLSRDGVKPSSFKTYTVHYGWVVKNAKRDIIDEVILTVMRSPRSYTKEDIVEVNCHGGIIPTRAILELVVEEGARLAEPGEFTKRAFLNGRINLSEAEAVLDIIRAKTEMGLKVSIAQLKGGLSREINKIRNGLLNALSNIEAAIDFPEEGLNALNAQEVYRELKKSEGQLRLLLEGSKRGRILREGLHVVICGRPNVGKSSLLNALLKKERSIVTPVAGTTRDSIEEVIDIKGIPVRIVDTAGILEPRDLIEKKAVSRAKEHIADASLVLLLFDGSRGISKEDEGLIRKLKNKQVIAIINKVDLKQKIQKHRIEKAFPRPIELSAKKFKNINLLEDSISDLVFKGALPADNSVMVTNVRQANLMKRCEKLVAQALTSLDNKLSWEFVVLDLKEALRQLDDLLGRDFSDELLGRIFSEFCIGK